MRFPAQPKALLGTTSKPVPSASPRHSASLRGALRAIAQRLDLVAGRHGHGGGVPEGGGVPAPRREEPVELSCRVGGMVQPHPLPRLSAGPTPATRILRERVRDTDAPIGPGDGICIRATIRAWRASPLLGQVFDFPGGLSAFSRRPTPPIPPTPSRLTNPPADGIIVTETRWMGGHYALRAHPAWIEIQRGTREAAAPA